MKNFEQETNESFKTAGKAESEDGDKWEYLQSFVESKRQFDTKIIGAVEGSCIAYLEDTRALIPAGQLSPNYVEEPEDYANKHIMAAVITVDSEKKRLVLSYRVIEREEKEKKRAVHLVEFKVGDMLDGKVGSLRDYGTFIDLGGTTGLLHVSQTSRKGVKAPTDTLEEGQEVKVKITKIGDGRIPLSMRTPEEPDDHFDGRSSTLKEADGFRYERKIRVAINLDDLPKNIKL